MFPPQLLTGQGPSSQGAPSVPPVLPGDIVVIWPISSASTPYGQLRGTHGRPPVSLPMNRFQTAVESRRTDVVGIVKLSPLPDISYDKFDVEYQSNVSSDFGGVERKAPTSLKQTEFSLKQCAKKNGAAHI
jgi:hypothetical protein